MRRKCLDCQAVIAAKYARYCDACRWRHRQKKPKYVWTAEKDAFVRARYSPFKRRCGDAIGQLWGWPGWVVRKRASRLGLSKPNWRTLGIAPWTKADELFLLNHAGNRHVRWIAKQLKRTETAVVVKMKRLGMSRTLDGYTERAVAEGFGVDPSTVRRWADRGWLDVRYRGEAREKWRITDDAITQFIRTHRNAYDLAKVDQGWFLDYALGPLSVDRELLEATA